MGNIISENFVSTYEEAAWTTEDVQQPEDGSYEVRQYKPAYWVATKVKASTYREAGNRSFRLLFNYITGKNQERTNIAMTIPVSLKETEAEADDSKSESMREYNFAFYVASKFQENPPQPEHPSVFLEKREQQTFYVTTFGGRPNDATVKQYEETLYADLQRNGVDIAQIRKKSMVFAQYNSPFKLFNRRNEIWVPADP